MNQNDISEAVRIIQQSSSHSPGLLSFLPVLTSKWIAPVLWALIRKSPLSFQEIRAEVGPITNTTLSKTLREMELEGLIVRTSLSERQKLASDNMEFEEMPFGHPGENNYGQYSPTPIGIEFSAVLVPLLEWAARYRIEQYGTPSKRNTRPTKQ